MKQASTGFSMAIFLMVCTCCAQQPASPTLEVTGVTIAGPASFTILGQTGQLTATAYVVGGGSEDVTNRAVWESSSPGVTSVSPAGLVTVNGVGETFVRATYKEKVGGLAISVLRARPVSIAITPETSALKIGQSQEFWVSVVLGPGVPLPAGPAPNWSSTNSSVIAIDGQGVAIARSVGDAIIQVVFYGQMLARQLHVEP